jgi:hypothetical protein
MVVRRRRAPPGRCVLVWGRRSHRARSLARRLPRSRGRRCNARRYRVSLAEWPSGRPSRRLRVRRSRQVDFCSNRNGSLSHCSSPRPLSHRCGRHRRRRHGHRRERDCGLRPARPETNRRRCVQAKRRHRPPARPGSYRRRSGRREPWGPALAHPSDRHRPARPRPSDRSLQARPPPRRRRPPGLPARRRSPPGPPARRRPRPPSRARHRPRPLAPYRVPASLIRP